MKLRRLKLPMKATPAERYMAAALMLVLLFAPELMIVTVRSFRSPGFWPLSIPAAAMCALLGCIAVGVYRNNPAALTRAAWAYAAGWAAVIELFYGIFIAVAGRIPSKLASPHVARSHSIMNFLLAATWSVLAFGLSRWTTRTA